MFNEELKFACSGYPNCKNIVEISDKDKKSFSWVSPGKLQDKIYPIPFVCHGPKGHKLQISLGL